MELRLYEDAVRSEGQKTLTSQLPITAATDFSLEHAHSRIFVVNAHDDRIDVFHDGQPHTGWGSSGTGEGEFCFAGTATVLVDLESGKLLEREVFGGGITRDASGSVYVAATFNNRIQKFRP